MHDWISNPVSLCFPSIFLQDFKRRIYKLANIEGEYRVVVHYRVSAELKENKVATNPLVMLLFDEIYSKNIHMITGQAILGIAATHKEAPFPPPASLSFQDSARRDTDEVLSSSDFEFDDEVRKLIRVILF